MTGRRARLRGRDGAGRRALLWFRDDESRALTGAAGVFVLTALIALMVFYRRDVPIDGRGSAGELAAICAAVAAAGGFIAARLLAGTRAASSPRARYRWFDLAALALAHAAIALLGWIGVAAILQESFLGATLYATPAALLTAAAAALTAYLAFLSGSNLSPGQLSLVLAVFLVVGTVTAMLSASDPLWWQMNLSALGITHDVSSLTFNLTLIVSGILVTTIARVGTATLVSFTRTQRRRRDVVRVLFVLIGVLLACVGVFPVDRFFVLHNTVATGMAVAYAVLVIGLPWLVPGMPRVFLLLGFVYAAVIAGLAVLFFTGVYNLTAVELVAAVLIFSWIILFLRNVQAMAAAGDGY